MLSDARLALRQLAKTPGFTATAVFTLALAIGVNSALFALINGIIFRPLVPDRPEQVVNVFTGRQNAKRDFRQFSHAEFLALRESNEVFADVAAVEFSLAGVEQGGALRRSFVFFVSENFLPMLGTKPARGRFFTAEECRPNADLPVAVVSHAFWQKNGGRDDFVGSTVRANGHAFTVVGVTPAGFSGLNAVFAPDLWLPLGAFSRLGRAFSDNPNEIDLASPTNYTLNVVARLQPGLTPATAEPRLPVLAARLQALQPPDGAQGDRMLLAQKPSRFNLSTDPSDDGPIAMFGGLLLAMSGIVLLIACLNLANMMLARGAARTREMAVRLAVGATRWQIVRQLLVEGLLLALAGGAFGLLLSLWSGELLTGAIPGLLGTMSFSLALQLAPDFTVIAVTFLFCVLATLLFSLGPALRSSRVDVVHDLKQGAGGGAAIRWNRLFTSRSLLVMGQLTLSLALIFASGLFFRGALKAGSLTPGFRPQGNLVAEMDFSLTQATPPQSLPWVWAMLEQAAALPGFSHAAVATAAPYTNVNNSRRIRPAAAPDTSADPNAPAPGANGDLTAVSAGYFDALGIRLLRGRDFTALEAQSKDAPGVIIIDEGMARALFPEGDALGQRVRYTSAPADGSPVEMEVIGIVNAHRRNTLTKGDALPKRIFLPFVRGFTGNLFLHAQLAEPRDEDAAAGAWRDSLRQIDSTLPVLAVQPFTRLMQKDIGLWVVRFAAILFGIFGAVALLLAAVGVYGVNAYSVASRTREIGVRMALGAQPADVLRLILGQSLRQTALALGAGIGLSLLVGLALSKMLYQVSPYDPLVLAGALFILAATALAACALPARRATRVSPMSALRSE